MRCGVLSDATGQVKQTWVSVNQPVSVPVEDGDIIIEWEVSHFDEQDTEAERANRTTEALKEQQRIHRLRSHEDTLQHCETKERTITLQAIAVQSPTSSPLMYESTEGLHERIMDDQGDVQIVKGRGQATAQQITKDVARTRIERTRPRGPVDLPRPPV